MHVNFRTKKRFGQHFLVDQQIIDLITKHINAKSDDLIVEIGPGNGAITEPLALSKPMMHLIEFDRELIPILQKKFASYANTKIHHEDALKFDYSLLGQKLRLVGNLPYNISTPLLFHLIKYRKNVTDQHFMLQKEVADRLTAKPGNKTFSKLTIMFGTFMNSEHLFDVPAAAFKPRPKVISSVVRIIPKNDNQILVNDPIILEKIVTSAFTQRRKTLRNSLKGIISDKIMQELGINPNQRAEELPIPVWTKLANKLTE